MSVRLIVGLGNPDMDRTRHNLGRMVVEALAVHAGATFSFDKKFKAKMASLPKGETGKKVLLAIPETYMNNSGQAVLGISQYYDILPEEMVVVVDEMAFPLGQLKLLPKGGSGGHNGLADIENVIGQNYPRLRLGIGAAIGKFEDHVLGRFSQSELELLPIKEAVDALVRLTKEDFARVATEINTKKG